MSDTTVPMPTAGSGVAAVGPARTGSAWGDLPATLHANRSGPAGTTTAADAAPDTAGSAFGDGPAGVPDNRVVRSRGQAPTSGGASWTDDRGVASTARAVRVGCQRCGAVLWSREDPRRVPVHAAPAGWDDPFHVTTCAGGGVPVHGTSAVGVDQAPEQAGGGPLPEDACRRDLPTGLHWRVQPFSHADSPEGQPEQPRG